MFEFDERDHLEDSFHISLFNGRKPPIHFLSSYYQLQIFKRPSKGSTKDQIQTYFIVLFRLYQDDV